MIVKTGTVDGKQIEIHEDSHGRQRFWAKVDGTALFQRGRIRLRTFATVGTAWKAALEEVRA
jgi:hypothetical protein